MTKDIFHNKRDLPAPLPPRGNAGEKVASEIESAFGEAETGVRNDIHRKSERTTGLLIFDNILFNLTNLSVFALSVYATYKSNYSQPQNTPKEMQNWWMRRSSEFTSMFKKAGLDEEKAKSANMILWSFIDGSLAAPFVALLKQKRSQIAHWIDDRLGTTPQDKSIYEHQPIEGWKSVLKGRLAAFLVVMPTNFLLSAKNKSDPSSLSLNNIFFDKTADAIVKNNVAGIPGALKKKFPKLDINGLVKTSVFEVFYTTLCTSVLFLVSFFTGKRDLHASLHENAVAAKNGPVLQGTEEQEANNARSSWRTRNEPRQQNAGYAQTVTQSRMNTTNVNAFSMSG